MRKFERNTILIVAEITSIRKFLLLVIFLYFRGICFMTAQSLKFFFFWPIEGLRTKDANLGAGENSL